MLDRGQVRYRWSESGSMDHYRHAHAFDHLVGLNYVIPKVIVC